MRDVYIVSAVRTPIGKFGGALAGLSPVALGAHAMRAALDRAGLEGHEVDLYAFGHILRAGQGQLTPRQAARRAGIPKEVDGFMVDMVCSSGMMAIATAANFIRLGEAELVLAGGMESMSQAGFYLSHRARWGYKLLLGTGEPLVDIMMRDGLSDAESGEAMGEQTERLAADFGVGREELDEIAAMSHRRAAAATEQGLFAREIAPIEVAGRKGPQLVERDEGIRPETTPESLARLRPAFRPDGVLTAGNSSQISDGAAALVLAGEEAVKRHNLRPLARLLKGVWVAGEPWRFPEAPVPAVRRLLERLNMSIADFDLFENNEAFALNSVLFHRLLGVPHDRLNVFGGAVALGHPLGATGARIVVTLLNALDHHGGRYGLAALCHGGGGATALAVERLT
ncbi:MAG: thiolase family protein [Ardenticatenia bacterium]|nr:thiolase family protein [Ardenticatenia bacterium]